ncbi:Uncharacterised protein [Mycobacterium tuberculosis]|nr:Uncharacterised protein [Mycobacterium tuberculosis]
MRPQRVGRQLPIPLGASTVDHMARRQQRLGDRRSARRCRPVQRIGGPQHQPLGVVGGVEPATGALRVAEMRHRGVQQSGSRRQPRALGGQLVERQQPGGQHRVVLQDGGAVADHPAQAGPAQAAVDDVQVQQPGRAAPRGVRQRGVVQGHAGFGQRGDRQPVPGRDDLVVAGGLGPGQAGHQQRGADPVQTRRVVGVGGQLQHRRPVLEGAGLGHPENLCRPTAVVAAEHLGQLHRRPNVGRTLAAVGVGIQRRGEHVGRCFAAQLVEQKSRGLGGDPAGQRIPGTAGPVRVGAQQQRVVVQHLLEMRYHPGTVDAVSGETAAELVIDAATGHGVSSACDRLQRLR